MSTSDLYILNRKSVTHLDEFRNGWGSGPVVWDYLAEKYIPEKPAYCFDKEHMKKVDALQHDPRLERDELLAFRFTCERAFIPRAKLAEAADHFATFALRTSHMPGVNHWRAFSFALRQAFEQPRKWWHRSARGICLTTSSVDDRWGQRDKDYIARAWDIFNPPWGDPK